MTPQAKIWESPYILVSHPKLELLIPLQEIPPPSREIVSLSIHLLKIKTLKAFLTALFPSFLHFIHQQVLLVLLPKYPLNLCFLLNVFKKSLGSVDLIPQHLPFSTLPFSVVLPLLCPDYHNSLLISLLVFTLTSFKAMVDSFQQDLQNDQCVWETSASKVDMIPALWAFHSGEEDRHWTHTCRYDRWWDNPRGWECRT